MCNKVKLEADVLQQQKTTPPLSQLRTGNIDSQKLDKRRLEKCCMV